VSTTLIHEDIVTQNDDLIVHVVSSLGMNESNLLPYDFHYTFGLECGKQNSLQETCEYFLECCVSLGGYESSGLHEFPQGGQMEHTLADETTFTQQLCLLYQVQFWHYLQDLMATYMETVFSNDTNVPALSFILHSY
jgi:hypothetical protein